MKESARTALSFLKVHYRRLGLRADFAHEKDIHIHVPEGAIPKDGPSAGITLAAALLSAFVGTPVAKGYAMTGEITLTGRILPIGGVKEKVLAAYRNKMTTVVMPEGNRKDIDELPKEVRNTMKFFFSDSALDALLTLVR
jgi:ATP-dependent Lon protease